VAGNLAEKRKSKKQKAESKNARADRAIAAGFLISAFCFLL
jgi:hypothetical protein